MADSAASLRQLAEDALRKQLFSTAAFFANKLVATDGG
jgi:hypothetical protein